MSDANLIAERYVSALFALATEKNQQDHVKRDLLSVQHLLKDSKALHTLFTSPVVSRNTAGEGIAAILTQAGACELTQQFFGLLARKRRLALTDACIQRYLAQLAQSRGELTVDVTSAAALNKDQARLLSDALAKSTQKKIALTLSENPALIGGVQVKIGSMLFDNSIASKLSRIKASLSKAA